MLIQDAIRLMREVCALRHLSINTEKTYTYWLARYGVFLKDPKLKAIPPEKKIERFLTRLALEGVSASTQNQAFNALLFFYRDVLKQELGAVDSLRAKRSATIRQCPTQDEVRQLLAAVSDIYKYPTRLITHLLYGCGLRVSEPLNLRIKDVDVKEGRFYIYQSKGNKGRVVLFPKCLTESIQRQLVIAKAVAAQDRARGIPVPLPGLAITNPSPPLSSLGALLTWRRAILNSCFLLSAFLRPPVELCLRALWFNLFSGVWALNFCFLLSAFCIAV